MKTKLIILLVVAVLIGSAGMWLAARRATPAVSAPDSTLRWERISDRQPARAGGSYIASSKVVPIQCLVAVLTDKDGELSAGSVDRVSPVEQEGAQVFRFSDDTLVDSKWDEGKGHPASSVTLAVNDIFVTTDLGHGVEMRDLNFRSGDAIADPLVNRILSLIEAGDGGGKYDFSSKVYRFADSGRVICIVVYAKI